MNWDTFFKLNLSKDEIQPHYEKVIGFLGERVTTKGYIDMRTRFGTGSLTQVISVCYLVIDAKTSYNILLGRPSLNKLEAIVSTPL